MTIRITLALVAGLGAFGACSPTDVCPCSPPVFVTSVAGFTLNGDGSPESARLDVAVRESGCVLDSPDAEAPAANELISEATGRYLFLVHAFDRDSLCLRITAHRLTAADSTVRDSVYIVPGAGDTVRVDLTLP